MGGKKQSSDYSDDESDNGSFQTYEMLIEKVKKETMEEGENVQLEKQKRKFINEIKSLTAGSERPLNVVVVGPPGVGKSSFINSIAAAFSWNRWREYAYTGWHGGEAIPVTAHVNSFPKCCNAAEYQDHNLPQLIDVAGFALENTPEWKELLHIVLFGRLPVGESLISAHAYCKKYGVHGLKAKYSTYEETLKVDRLVFVGSYTEEVPKSLIDLVVEAARPIDDHEMVVPIFGVLTKADAAESIPSDKVKERERDFVNALGLGGARNRFLSCRNYCDALDEKFEVQRDEKYIPQLDVPILRFMRQVCDPVITVQNAAATYLQREQSANESQKQRQTETRGSSEVNILTRQIRHFLTLGLEFILIGLMFYLYMAPGFDPSNLRSFCLQHGHTHSEAARKLCADTNDGKSVGTSFLFPFIIYVVIRGMSIFVYNKLRKLRIVGDGESWKIKRD